MLENAKRHIIRQKLTPPKLPNSVFKISKTSSEEAVFPKFILPEWVRIVNAVKVQSKIVSTKTSKMPYNPWVLGSASIATECAIAEVPRPASLEKIPRDAPINIEENILPTAPPVTAFGLKAPVKIILKHWGKTSMFRHSTATQITM